ncbi:helix-turn-helix domain-containing protein [Pectobacteriaceae bacterium CE90]|nr:helix-turn-helix domain-containing protein [Pectobacteriaceae bacterium CE90]
MNAIKSLRLSRAWSQEQLAELASLSVRTIQRIENGEQASLETLSAIAAALEVRVADLMENSGERHLQSEPLEQRILDAKHQVREEGKFLRSLILFAVINSVLFVVNRLIDPHTHWFLWPLLIWGGLLVIKAINVFFLRNWLVRWQQGRLQKILRK